jgi:integrase
MCALRFFYGTTLGLSGVAEQIPLARKADTLPVVLARDEVVRFLKATLDLKMRTAFITIYSAGLRVSEAVALTARDIDSARMVLHVRQGKGRKDRYVMLSEQLLAVLRDYWKRERPQLWLFPGPDPTRPIPRVPYNAPVGGLLRPRASTRLSPFTRCGTASPPISWSRASTSG